MPRAALFVLDLALVGLFAVLGRLSHYDSLSLEGWWTTAWPFLLGTILAWVVLVLAHRSVHHIEAGVIVWLVTLVGGMMLRLASDQGTALPFVIVATLVLGLFLVLPRVGLLLVQRSANSAR